MASKSPAKRNRLKTLIEKLSVVAEESHNTICSANVDSEESFFACPKDPLVTIAVGDSLNNNRSQFSSTSTISSGNNLIPVSIDSINEKYHLKPIAGTFITEIPAMAMESSKDTEKLQSYIKEIPSLTNKHKTLDFTLQTMLHRCNVCDESFINHIIPTQLSYVPQKMLQCCACEKLFEHLHGLKAHQDEHDRKQLFLCDSCDQCFDSFEGLDMHKKSTHEASGLLKDSLKEKDLMKNQLVVDQRKDAGEKLPKCRKCDKQFASLDELSVQWVLHINGNMEQWRMCNKCVEQTIHFRIHQKKIHDKKKFQCDTCGKCYSYLKGLKEHKLTHNDDSRLQCSVCEKRFGCASKLRRHQLIHTDERPFKCSTCDKSFTRSDELKRHFFKHSDERPFQCRLCQKSFKSASELKVHGRKAYQV